MDLRCGVAMDRMDIDDENVLENALMQNVGPMNLWGPDPPKSLNSPKSGLLSIILN